MQSSEYVNGFRHIKEQFKLRSEKFDYSAKWIKDENLLDIHKRLITLKKNTIILDLCCGSGIVGEQLLNNNQVKVIGLDLSMAMLFTANKRLNYCVNARAEELPFLSDSCDVIVCRQALHFLDIEKIIDETYRVCKGNGGQIILSQIVPFNEKDSPWLYKIHCKKQPLLRNFLHKEDIISLLQNSGCKNIVSYDCNVEESIFDWLNFTPELSPDVIEEVKQLFLNAPLEYKLLHNTKIFNDRLYDTMRWTVIKGIKI